MTNYWTSTENLLRYQAAWQHLENAITELENATVGPNKKLYKTIEKVIEEIGGVMLLINTELIDPCEKHLKS